MKSTEVNIEELYDISERIILELQSTFPTELKNKCDEVPCFLQDEANLDNAEIWGCCPGGGMEGSSIVIYVGTIYKKCQRDNEDFKSWIENVYLHELGHVLGLTESELRNKGL